MAKLEQAIDAVIHRYDPAAVRRTREAVRGRGACFGREDDVAGTTSLWGRLYATDAAVLKKRLAHMVSEVCADDPRTAGQRRADALGTLAAGGQHLVCQCGDPECPAGGEDARAANTVVYVIAEQAALEAKPDPYLSGDHETMPVPYAEESAPTPATAAIVGGGLVPTPLPAQLVESGAAVRPLALPAAEAEPRYRPSARLATFVRMQDMTCRFPGCSRPAECCDVDHATPYPWGVTHPSNT